MDVQTQAGTKPVSLNLVAVLHQLVTAEILVWAITEETSLDTVANVTVIALVHHQLALLL